MIIDPFDLVPPAPVCVCTGPPMAFAGRRRDGRFTLRVIHAGYCDYPDQMETVRPEACASCSGSGPFHDPRCREYIDLINPMESAT